MRERTWIEIAVAIVALIVSGVSLWVGVRTEDANEQLVATSTWPYVEIQKNNATPSGVPEIQYLLINGGVGPAKIESFELFYKGKAMPSMIAYLQACCRFDLVKYHARYLAAPEGGKPTPIISGTPANIVLRPGETRSILTVALGADDADLWRALDHARAETTFDACYCSALDRCWRSDLRGLHPERVDKCTAAKQPFDY